MARNHWCWRYGVRMFTIIAAIWIALAQLSSPSLQAQTQNPNEPMGFPQPCEPDSCEPCGPFSDRFCAIVPLPCGDSTCYYVVIFRYRSCLYIESIEFHGNDARNVCCDCLFEPSDTCKSCLTSMMVNMNPGDLFNQLTARFFAYYYANTAGSIQLRRRVERDSSAHVNDTCIIVRTIVKHDCWGRCWYSANSPLIADDWIWRIVPCGDQYCCCKYYKICHTITSYEPLREELRVSISSNLRDLLPYILHPGQCPRCYDPVSWACPVQLPPCYQSNIRHPNERCGNVCTVHGDYLYVFP